MMQIQSKGPEVHLRVNEETLVIIPPQCGVIFLEKIS